MLRILRRLSYWMHHRREARDLAAELEFHRTMKTEELRSSGVPDAEVASRREMGNAVLFREEARSVWIWPWLESAAQDLRYGARALTRHPGYSLAVIFVLTLGIGSTTTVFSLVDGVLFRPLPFRDPEQLYWIESRPWSASVLEYREWQRTVTSFDAIVTSVRTRLQLQSSETPELLEGSAVPAAIFDTLGVDPVLGRRFLPEEDGPDADPVVLLGYRTWQDLFGGDPSVLGQAITLGDRRYSVIGILPAELYLPILRLGQFWIPLGLEPERLGSVTPMPIIARMRPSSSVEQAVAELNSVSAEYAGVVRDVPEDRSNALIPLHDVLTEAVTGGAGPILPLILLGSVLLVLLVALANATTLMLGHATWRSREIAARLAVGAGPLRVMRQLMTESLVLTVLGGGLGLLATAAAVRALLLYLPQYIPRIDEVGVNWRVGIFALTVVMVSGVIYGAYPAWLASRHSPSVIFRQGSGEAPRGLLARGIRGALTVAEVAVAMILCTAAGLLIQSFVALQSVELGIDPENVVAIDLSFETPEQVEQETVVQFFRRLEAEVRKIPGVVNVSLSTELPTVGANNFVSGVSADDSPAFPPDAVVNVELWNVTPEYFDALGIELIRGRTFTDPDDEDAPRVLVVSEAAARHFWPGQDPIGQVLRTRRGIENEVAYTVVGVVGDVIESEARADGYAVVYWSMLSYPLAPSRFLVVRTGGDPRPVIPSLRDAIWSVYPDQTIPSVDLFTDLVFRRFAVPRFRSVLLTGFGFMALIIAAIGVYGVVSYGVARRTREIGVRMALGSQRRDVVRLVTAEGMFLIGLGIALGVVASLFSAEAIESLLVGISPADPNTYITVALVFVIAGAAACWFPARRATRIDPIVALRYD